MLSDEGSKVIREFGILNTLVNPDETTHYGIPFPGSYLTDADGRVTDKFFHREYQVRETATTVLSSGFDLPVDIGSFTHVETEHDGVKLSVALGATELHFMQHADLYVDIDLDEGLHVYGQTVPDGYVPTEVTVTGTEGLRVGQPKFPDTKPFHVEGIADEFQVLGGKVRIAVPLISAIREVESVSIDVEICYQACNDQECFIPKRETFNLEVPLQAMVRSAEPPPPAPPA